MGRRPRATLGGVGGGVLNEPDDVRRLVFAGIVRGGHQSDLFAEAQRCIQGSRLLRRQKYLRRGGKRLGTPDDVINVIDFFTRPESDYVTGQVIRLGGA